MERLTQWIDENRAIPRVDLRRCGHERCTTQLARYEDTGLTPDQIMGMKERNTPKEAMYETYGDQGCGDEPDAWICPNCEAVYDIDDDYDFCPDCGQMILR